MKKIDKYGLDINTAHLRAAAKATKWLKDKNYPYSTYSEGIIYNLDDGSIFTYSFYDDNNYLCVGKNEISIRTRRPMTQQAIVDAIAEKIEILAAEERAWAEYMG